MPDVSKPAAPPAAASPSWLQANALGLLTLALTAAIQIGAVARGSGARDAVVGQLVTTVTDIRGQVERNSAAVSDLTGRVRVLEDRTGGSRGAGGGGTGGAPFGIAALPSDRTGRLGARR